MKWSTTKSKKSVPPPQSLRRLLNPVLECSMAAPRIEIHPVAEEDRLRVVSNQRDLLKRNTAWWSMDVMQ
eukprot:3503496-Amphidinium_carterae.1